MPRAILEFNLPEEQFEFDQASNASKYCTALWELEQFLRDKTKHAPDSVTKEQLNAYHELFYTNP